MVFVNHWHKLYRHRLRWDWLDLRSQQWFNFYVLLVQFASDVGTCVFLGGAVEKDRTGTSHESFLLMANSQTDMEEWIRAIRRAIWAPLGGGKPPPQLPLLYTHRYYDSGLYFLCRVNVFILL